jgi:hypothetical protein
MIPATQRNTTSSSNVLSATAFNALASLDNNGYLADLVDRRNWTAIHDCLEGILSPSLWFNLTVYDENMTSLNTTPICTGTAISNHIEAANYLCPTTNQNYEIYFIRLQLAGLS